MSFVLRIEQHYDASAASVFFELEAKFQALERASPGFPQGRRYQLMRGGESAPVFVWECEFPSLFLLQEGLQRIENDSMHTALFTKQSPYIVSSLTKIYQVLTL